MDKRLEEKTKLLKRIAAIKQLIARGATEGERQAAEKALDRIINSHGLNRAEITGEDRQWHKFKYSSELDKKLIIRLVRFFLNDGDGVLEDHAELDTWGVREVRLRLDYFDWVTIYASYEYFRRHMKKQWQLTGAKVVARCRKTKTKNAKRKELQEIFFSQYVIASKLYGEGELQKLDLAKMSAKEMQNRIKLAGVQGGTYHKQMTGGLMLGDGKQIED